MSNFGFALKQRVTVPGEEDLQGVVSARCEQVAGENEYDIAYLDDSLTVAQVCVTESILTAAQPAPTVTLETMEKAVATAREAGARDALDAAAKAACSKKQHPKRKR